MVLTDSKNKLNKGDNAPDFKLIGTDDNSHQLSEIKGKKATLIIFICNHCPYVIPKFDEIKRITSDFKEKGLTVIGINPNEDKNYPDDSFDNMKKTVQEKGINFYYLRDESQQVAKAYGAVCTPDPFLFDNNLKLIFHSRIDDTHGSEPANTHEIYNAIEEFLGKGEISANENPSRGCSIKWKY